MPVFDTRVPEFKQNKAANFSWDNFRKGLNVLLKETEIDEDELAKTDNIMLVGKGVPTKRWGTNLYFMSGLTGSTRSLKGFYQANGTNELLAVTDAGFLNKKSNASYTRVSGFSWASGSVVNMEQISNRIYVVSSSKELARYDGTTLEGFPTIAVPSNVFATQISGASGTNRYGYRVSAISSVGETLASNSVELLNQPQDLTLGTVKLSWDAVSTASGILTGYNIYGRTFSDERFLGTVGAGSTTFLDDGSAVPQEFTFPPLADSTGGPKAKYIERFQDRLIFAGLDGDSSKVLISGREPNHEKFDLSYGGNFIRIEPDAGDPITGLKTFQDRIIVFKERSIWQITLGQEQIGNFFVTIPNATLITGSHGCIAPKSIRSVENDVFFVSRKGVYALGYEPNILNVLRTNEISAKIRPIIQDLTISQLQNASAFYADFKYGISFPGTDKTYVYDRERLGWTGPWTKDSDLFHEYFDANNDELLLASDSGMTDVQEYSLDYRTDNGTEIVTELQTRKEDYGDWAVFKNINEINQEFRNIQGTVLVTIRIQNRRGEIVSVKSFNITSSVVNNSGWGSDQWADFQWADSSENGVASDINEVYREAIINKAARNVQIIIQTSGSSNYELLSIKSTANPIGPAIMPAGERV